MFYCLKCKTGILRNINSNYIKINSYPSSYRVILISEEQRFVVKFTDKPYTTIAAMLMITMIHDK